MACTRTKMCSQCETLQHIVAQTCDACTGTNMMGRNTLRVLELARTTVRDAIDAIDALDTKGAHTPLVDHLEALVELLSECK